MDSNQPNLDTSKPRTWARRMFVLGNLNLIFGGGLHTLIHFVEMRGPSFEAALRGAGKVEVVGSPLEVWDVFQGQSMIYGAVFIAMGLTNLASLRASALPAWGSALAGVGLFAVMTVVGFLHLGPLQTIGGPFGMVLFGATLAVRLSEHQ